MIISVQERCPNAVINKTKGFCKYSHWDNRACVCGIPCTPVYNKHKKAHLCCPYAYKCNPQQDKINLFTGEPLKKIPKHILEGYGR